MPYQMYRVNVRDNALLSTSFYEQVNNKELPRLSSRDHDLDPLLLKAYNLWMNDELLKKQAAVEKKRGQMCVLCESKGARSTCDQCGGLVHRLSKNRPDCCPHGPSTSTSTQNKKQKQQQAKKPKKKKKKKKKAKNPTAMSGT